MNKDQAKGSIKDAAGKAQKKFGEVTDNEEQEAKGMKNQAEGKVQKGYGESKDAVKGSKDKD